MRAVFLGAVVVGIIVGGIVAGVRAVAPGDGGGASAADGSGARSAPAEASPQNAAEQWAKAWTAGNIDALYQLLTPEAQQLVSSRDFTATYRTFANEVTQSAIEVKLSGLTNGRASFAVHVSTTYFGDLEYTTALSFSNTSAGWRTSWDPSAVHPEMTGGRTFSSAIERPARGAILDRKGTPLAITRDVRMLGLNRAVVVDRAALTAAVAPLGLTKAQVDAAFNAGGGPTQRIDVGAVPDDKAELANNVARGVPGVLLYFQSQRVHPLGAAAAHVVGYTRELTAEELEQRKGTGVRIGDRVGATGLERSLDKDLAGQSGAALRIVEADGTTEVRTLMSREMIAPKDITTTLDAATLQAAQARLGARAGAAVVIDPRTNEILALNSSPSFNPDAFERNDRAQLQAISDTPKSPQTNRAIGGLYSAGSTFKLITGAAGLAYGGFKTSDQIFCGATWNGVDPPRKNWEGTQGPLTIAQGLMRSCNPVFYEIGLKLYNTTPPGQLSKMARLFGFGSETGVVGLSDEEGLVPDPDWKKAKRNELWFPGDEVNLAIGQGDLLITPLQLANAYSSFLAGNLRVPVLLAGQPAAVRNELPLTAEQKAHLRSGLQLVTSAAGTASAAFANAGYTDFGGKSGTAEDAGAQQHVLFVAYSPAATPRAVAAVVLDDGDSGSIEAGPIARDIVLTAIKQ